MTDKELQKLVDEYNDYKSSGKLMSYYDFMLMFEELLKRYNDTHPT